MSPQDITRLKRLAVYFSEELENHGEAGTVLAMIDQRDIDLIDKAIKALEAGK